MFCSNCGTQIQEGDIFCQNCGNRVDGIVSPVDGPGGNASSDGQKPNKRKGLLISLGAAVVVLVLVIGIAVAAMSGLFMGPAGKVLKAVAATMKDTPEIVSNLKVIPDILTGNQYTVGFTMEYDGDSVSGEFRNTVNDKQIYYNADVEGDEIDFLCGVHSGVLKASVSELDYVFIYNPQGKNDGILCENIRKKEMEEFNSMLENITTEKVTFKEIQKDITAAFVQEFKELQFKEVKAKEFKVDGKNRDCKGYRVKMNEKNIAHVLENAGERIGGRLAEDVRDSFGDMMDDLIDEVEDDDVDMDFTFYLYKGKLAAVILEIDDYAEEEICIAFQGGDYRMQNMLITVEHAGDVLGEIPINVRKKGSKETIEIDVNGYQDIALSYDTKSGAVSLEYDAERVDYLIEGTYKHSGSEASFTLEEFEYNGDSLMEEEDIGFTLYVKKDVQIEKYSGDEFDLGSADEDDFRDLADDLEDLAHDLIHYNNVPFMYLLYDCSRKLSILLK